jgi:two-component system, NarL family, response regulator LiaR
MISISIVEDHEHYRSTLVKAINGNKLLQIVGIYESAELAMEPMQKNPADIAIVDIELQTISGIELIKFLKSKEVSTQFLMCTSYQNNENVFSALRAGASGYLVKDASASEIENAIIELHQGGSPMNPYIARKVISLLHSQAQEQTFGLTERELEVIILLSKGLLYKEISDQLFISANTVKNHVKSIYKKLHVQNKVEAVNKYRSL